MILRNIRKVLKYGVFGSAAFGAAALAVKYHDVDTGSFTIVRILRTACTAIDIGRTYKSMLYNKEWDRNSEEYNEVRSQAHLISAEKLLELCKANKGVYIKIGQHIGALEYFLPNEYVITMRILHKDAPQNSVEELYKIIRDDLKKEPSELFDEFDPEPLGTASLAQVHRAKLKDGTEVAVKVQHQFVRKNIDLDMRWIEFVINVMARVFPDFEMQWLVTETKKNIAMELNFLNEGQNAEKAANLFKEYKWLKIPKIYWDYSTERVLVMEYVTGGQVNDLKYINKHNIDRFDLCEKIGTLYSHMIFEVGFVHSDPHPGNILVRKEPEDKDVTVYLLDHGLYGTLSEKFRYHYSKLWLSIISRNTEEMKIHAEQLGIRPQLYILFACMVTGRPWQSIMKGINKTKPSSAEKELFQNELPRLIHYITQCLEHVDRQAILVLKTNDLVRSIEYALKAQDRMCGFLEMTKCCMESVYQLEYKQSDSMFGRQYLCLRHTWSLFLIYIYGIYLNMWYKVNTYIPSKKISIENSAVQMA